MNLLESNPSIEIGGFNETFANDLITIGAHSEMFWATVGNALYYDGKAMDSVLSNPNFDKVGDEYRKAIFDTGTTYMALS